MSNHDEIPDDKLNVLQQTGTPTPSQAARQRALDAALLAFDAEQASQKQAAQGNPLAVRLRSIFSEWKGKWTMDTRLTYGLGTAAVALLLLPLGYQLYSTTAITPPLTNAGVDAISTVFPPRPEPQAQIQAEPLPYSTTETTSLPAGGGSGATQPGVIGQAGIGAETRAKAADADAVAPMEAAPSGNTIEMQVEVNGRAMQEAPMQEFTAAVPAAPPMDAEADMLMRPAPAPTTTLGAVPQTLSRDAMIAQPTAPSGDQFTTFSDSPVKIVREAPVSTFSIDVDTAAYSYVRRTLNEGWMPEPDAVRVEEMINYFDYAYPAPADASTPFSTSVQVYPAPWAEGKQLVRIGIKGYVPPVTEDKASNLVFLIDTSGSMEDPDKLPLLKRAFALLVEQMDENDTVSIVTYAGSAGVVLEPTKGTEKARILSALDNLSAGGSTAGAEGIELAYQLAAEHKVDGVNRVILATDGDFNVGIEDPDQLERFIEGKRDDGVFLSVLGFGAGNLGDDTMQALAQSGNGNASYIDSFKEAQKVLVEDAGGTLETIAKDVKIQVEFNPMMVSEYRLIGYETRALNREDFNNDQVDAGEIGAGTTVTALYEITPVGSDAALNDPLRYGEEEMQPAVLRPELGYLKLRYKLPNGDTSILVEQPIEPQLVVGNLMDASDDSRFAAAVAAFGQKLRGSDYAQMRWDEIRVLASGARGADENGYRAEFIQLVDVAAALQPEPLCTAPEGNRNCR
ncbi:MAG: vWA domain-containing protein [Devosia sp.]